MGRNIERVIAGLPKERRDRINAKARQMAGEMVAHAQSLADVRKAASKTQVQMGARLGKPQNAISQLERRSDLLVSTLVDYIQALGAELDLVVRMKDGTQVLLDMKADTAKSTKPAMHKKHSASATRRHSVAKR